MIKNLNLFILLRSVLLKFRTFQVKNPFEYDNHGFKYLLTDDFFFQIKIFLLLLITIRELNGPSKLLINGEKHENNYNYF